MSVSIDLGGGFYIIAHELGHNLDLDHAPGCGAPTPDPSFPNATGEVTTWGYDIHDDRLVAPGPTLYDFMSYCNDLWVSDYHFDRAIAHRDQSAIGFRVMNGPGLSISGRLGDAGIDDLRLLPTPQQVARAEIGELTHRFRAWDAAGVLVLDAPFTIRAIEDAEVEYGRFALNVARPTAAIHHYVITSGDGVLAAATLAGTASGARTVDVDTTGESASIVWQPGDGEALIVRDAEGRVIAVDRTGAFSLGGLVPAEMELVSRDAPLGRIAVHPGSVRREVMTHAQ